ncbi:MAG: Mur ligase domain-containing protein [Opitutales bacterium]|nr:Mur ligase domain-containing protein [Opitutales bacterium]
MHVYFLGIGGTAMGNIAVLLKRLGWAVSGSDQKLYPPMSELLSAAGIVWREGYCASSLARENPGLVIVGNAFSRGNEEIEWLLAERKIPFTSLASFIGERVIGQRQSLVVAGTHGKTTTSTILTYLLREAGQQPGHLIGGVPRGGFSGAEWGRPQGPFVIEGDEYDSAFFDKRSKFIHYRPRIAVVNNVEFDHADIFRDLADVKRTFGHFIRLIPRQGYLLLNGDDPNCSDWAEVPWTQVLRVGLGRENDLRIADFSENANSAYFRLEWQGKPWLAGKWSLPGIFNARNAAMATLAAALYLSPTDPTKAEVPGWSGFRGVRRRQESLGVVGQWHFFEDFGHHPTAIRLALESFRERFPQHQLVCAVEPRSNTLRTNCLEAELQKALECADEVLLGPVDRLQALALESRLGTSSIAERLRKKGLRAEAFEEHAELQRYLEEKVKDPQGQPAVLILFSNGAFGGLPAKLHAWAQE